MDFSVLMSVYFKESANNLRLCLDSLRVQSVLASEIIIVEDGPLSDELYQELDYWGDVLPIKRVVLSTNSGLGIALNHGLKHCSFELVARMDTDDVCHYSRFEKQLSAFDSNPSISICGTCIDEVNEIDKTHLSYRIVPESHNDIFAMAIQKNPFNHMTVMYRKSDILNVGGYIELQWMEDWYLWLRLLSAGKLAINLKENLVFASTGKAMILRRSGLSYVRSELTIAKYRYQLGLQSALGSFWVFIKRSVPRLLPQLLLHKIYLFSRNK